MCTLSSKCTRKAKRTHLARGGNYDSVLSLEGGGGAAEFVVLESRVSDEHLYDLGLPK